MAEQTFQIPAAMYGGDSLGGQIRFWDFPAFTRLPIDAALIPPGAVRFFGFIYVASNGELNLRIAINQTAPSNNPGDDLSSLFETSGSLTIEAGDLSLTANLAGSDFIEPYVWTPSNSDEVIAFFNALPTAEDTQAATLTLRDFVPVAPAFADDTGDDADWTRNTAIDAITIPRASGMPAPTYASVGDEPAGINIVLPTETADGSITGTPTAFDSGTITIRATNSVGSDDWTVNYTLRSGVYFGSDGVSAIRYGSDTVAAVYFGTNRIF